MRKTTKGHGLLAGAVITAAVVALMLLLTGILLAGYFDIGMDGADGLVTGLVVVYVLAFLAVAAGVVAALVQRWREVRGGEEDEAKKY